MDLYQLTRPCLSYDFSQILSFCEGKAAYFTLTRHVGYKNREETCSWFYELAPYKVFRFYSKEWYRYFHPIPRWYQINKIIKYRPWMWKKEITVYPFHDSTKKLLKQNIDDLFLFPETDKQFSDAPQDICFFRADQTMLIGTVTHEYIADIYLTELEKAKNHIPQGFLIENTHCGENTSYRYVPLKRGEWKETRIH